MFARKEVAAWLAFLLLYGCGSSADPTDDTTLEDPNPSPTYLAESDLPAGFPEQEVPVLHGRVVATRIGEAAGALPNKDAWAVEVDIDDDVEGCFRDALAALRGRGFEEGEAFTQGTARQVFMTSPQFQVMLAATESDPEGCSLTYAVGVDGLRVSG